MTNEIPQWRPPVRDEQHDDIRVIFDGENSKGGFGVVCFGTHMDIPREIVNANGSRATLKLPVAVKFWQPGPQNRAADVRFFYLEQARAYALQHGNIVRTLDVRDNDPSTTRPPLIVMPRYHFSLRDLVDELKKANLSLPREAFYRIFFEAANGLQFLHEQQFVHSDIKPENILIRIRGFPIPWQGETESLQEFLRKDEFVEVVVADLGVAQGVKEEIAYKFCGDDPHKAPGQRLEHSRENPAPAFDIHALCTVMRNLISVTWSGNP
jgi:serine/threonine protein kinase